LEIIGVPSRPAVEALVRAAVSDDGTKVNAAAALALTRIDPDGEVIVEHAKQADVHSRLIRVLRELGEQGRHVRLQLEFRLVDVARKSRTKEDIEDASKIPGRSLQRYLKKLHIAKTDEGYLFTREQWDDLINLKPNPK
jgi:hypothetical protein